MLECVQLAALLVLMVMVIGVTAQAGQHHTLIQPQQSTDLGNEDGTSYDVDIEEETRYYRPRQPTDTAASEGPGRGGGRQFGGGGGGGRRQFGGGGGGGGRGRKYPGFTQRRQFEGRGGGGRKFDVREGERQLEVSGGVGEHETSEGRGREGHTQYETRGGGHTETSVGGGGGGRGGGQFEANVGGGGGQFESTPTVGDEMDSVAGGVGGIDFSQRQTGAILLLLQRLSERLAGLETLQRQQAERIDTINYRITRIELQAEERKGVITELSNNVRHRMESTDNALDRVTTSLDQISTSITGLDLRQTELQSTINEIPKAESDREGRTNGLKLQAMMATIHGLRTATMAVKKDVASLAQNFTLLNNITENLTRMSQEVVTKQYLQQNLNELDTQDSSLTILARTMLTQSRGRRRGGGGGSGGGALSEAEDCWELHKRGKNQSGVYRIKPLYSPHPFFVYCNMETDGGGWTVIQRREDGTVDFLREWPDYKHGFGNLAGEFWLGNEKIHQLTNQYVSQLRVDLADFDQQSSYAKYSAFAVGSELEKYSLKMLGEFMGDAGDSLRYHVGRGFSTPDVDNDAWPDKSCARDHQGAWWYRACETSNLNGRYLHGPLPIEHQYTGLYWYNFRGPQYSLWRSRMMVRRGGTVSKPVFKNFTEIHNNPVTPGPDNNRIEMTTTPATEEFNPDHDPYATYDYPYY
ncbi:hypothetical protein Pmani_010005 [Petrolisthes manimaculis]|uniref:Fibrinogen C-terminal domain-containing protein n=1 Tax=Petrolisthes manimaculis TaxID=1843537 RepID=A0AAE1UG29_9EUCA|nr:hypothetical protein Pmani_010005 [Petrolisthes manimaculis]